MPTVVAVDRLERVRIGGKALGATITDRVTAAAISASTTETTQLDLTLTEGADFPLLSTGLFDAGTARRPGTPASFDDLELEVRAVELGPRGAEHELKITLRSRGWSRLNRGYGPLVRHGISPTDFARHLCHRAGLEFHGQPTSARKIVARKHGQDAESSWECLGRLAQDLGFLCFEAADVVYFGKPSWLAHHTTGVLALDWPSDQLDELPGLRRSGDNKRRLVEVTAAMRGPAAEAARPGMAAILTGVATFDGRYLVDGWAMDLTTTAPVSITAGTIDDPEVEKPKPKPKPKPDPQAST